MRILFLDQYSEMGGAQKGLLDLLPAIEERGWIAHAAIPGQGPLVEHLRSKNVGVVEIPCGPYQSGAKSAADALRFSLDVPRQMQIIGEMMERDRFDLVYVNGPRLLVAAAMAVRRRAPVLFHAHSHIPEGSQMRLARWSLRRMNAAVVACSKSVAPSSYAGKVSVIPNGCGDLGYRERRFDTWRIGVIGRISPEKGQLEFLEAAAMLAREFPAARFVICGAPLFAVQDYFECVQSEAQGLPVEFLGWREDIDSVFGDLDLLAVPSLQEGMGRVLVEAFSAGVPVVAFPVGGIPEVVTDRETGFLAAEVTPEALASRIREIMATDPEALRNIAANARRAWERLYTLDAYRKKVTDLMQQVVSDRQAAAGTSAPRQHI